jgi:acetyltransferase-like isoleucine patch superfamily enzyme
LKTLNKNEIIRDKLAQSRKSPFKAYKDLTVGDESFLYFLYYEIITMILGPMPGALGFFLRKKFYPSLFKKVGGGLIIGRNVVIRHPKKITLGDSVTIDDNCLIDGRGSGDLGVVFEDDVLINRNCMIQAKTGPIRFGSRTSIGSNCVIISTDGVFLEEAVLSAGGCYISAGAYKFDKRESAIMDQEAYSNGPIRIGANTWLGTGVIILDGVDIGEGVVIGAASMVNSDLPEFAIAVGIPAKVLKIRE